MSSTKITYKASSTRSALGQRIRQLRGNRTQAAFAALLGMKQPQLARYEAGQQPDPPTLTKVAKACGVTVDWLLTGEPSEHVRIRSDIDCRAALESVIAGTPVKLGRIRGPKVDRAWKGIPEEQREEVRNYLRRAAVVAIAIEQLLPRRSADSVLDKLSKEVTSFVTAKILGSARPAHPA